MKYYKPDIVPFYLFLSIIILDCALCFIAVLMENTPKTTGILISSSAFILFLGVFLLIFSSYPIISEEKLTVKWQFLPVMNKEWKLYDIERISFSKGVDHPFYKMTVYMKNGEVVSVKNMVLMSTQCLPSFINELQGKGISVENNLDW